MTHVFFPECESEIWSKLDNITTSNAIAFSDTFACRQHLLETLPTTMVSNVSRKSVPIPKFHHKERHIFNTEFLQTPVGTKQHSLVKYDPNNSKSLSIQTPEHSASSVMQLLSLVHQEKGLIHPLGDKQHQISSGDNCIKFFLPTPFWWYISMNFLHKVWGWNMDAGVLGLGFWGVGWSAVVPSGP